MSSEKLHPEGLLGKKIGMSQIFTSDGQCVPVTIVELGPCYILDVKNKDGYKAVQLGFSPKKAQRVDKALTGHFAKTGKGAFSHVKEVRCDVEALGWITPGQELKVGDIFADGELVDVSGVTIGRGFSGVVRRHGVKGQPATRGTHEVRRNIGSIGCRKFPGRVFPNKRMPGHMGSESVTVQNLKVVGVKPDSNLIMIRGGIPGYDGGLVVVRKAIKNYSPKKAA